MRPLLSAIVICMVCRSTAWSEASYQETTRITGGSITKMMSLAGAFSKNARKLEQPMVTTVAVKGNMMARDSQDVAEIIDLDARTITHIDKVKREYTVTTFQQMQEALQRAAAKAQAEKAKASAQAPTQQPQGQQADSNVQLTFQPTVRKTNAKRQINGLDTSEVILSLAVNGSDKRTGEQAGALGITEDMWLAPDVPGYGEVREFSQKLAKELGSQFRSAGANMTGLMAGQQVQSEQAFKDLAKEMSQIEGVPVLQVMRMGMTANGQPLPAASEVSASSSTTADPASPDSSLGSQVATASATAAQQTAAQEASQKIKGALGSGLGSAIGGFGGFGGRKKKAAPTPTTDSTQASTTTASASSSSLPQAQGQQSAVLVESTTEMANFTQQADGRLFQIPGGFRMVPSADAKN